MTSGDVMFRRVQRSERNWFCIMRRCCSGVAGVGVIEGT